jgi:ElaB/YqjD/DUF883 family membrane-anchored ribosome-binding protein
MATPERHWDPADHGLEARRPDLVGVDRDHAGPADDEIEDDPWAELGIAAVICLLLLALFLPGLS